MDVTSPDYRIGDEPLTPLERAASGIFSTLGFSATAALDDGAMSPTSDALTQLGAPDEKRIATLGQKATG